MRDLWNLSEEPLDFGFVALLTEEKGIVAFLTEEKGEEDHIWPFLTEEKGKP